MSQATIFLLAAAAVIGLGVYGLMVADHILRKLLSLNLAGGGVFLLLITLGGRGGAGGAGTGALDPIPQALVLTGIVVAVSATAFALALLDRLFRVTGQTRVDLADDDDDDEGEGEGDDVS
jgi:multicomponent Na+:H+ antiporter subunit C